ncbi:MAG: PPC domain-containing DNA-binding protein [Candidatus Acidiferrales bacterium]
MSRNIRSTIFGRSAFIPAVMAVAAALVFLAAAAPLPSRQEAQHDAQKASPQRHQFPPLPPGYIRPPMVVKTGLAPKMRVEELPTADSHTYEVSFGTGDEIISGLTQFAEQHHIVSAHLTGIGGLTSAKLGWGSPTIPGMKEIDVTQKCELVSLIGNISMRGQYPYVHLHGVVAFSDGSTKGGHVVEAHVDPIVEIFVVTTAAPLPASSPGSNR